MTFLTLFKNMKVNHSASLFLKTFSPFCNGNISFSMDGRKNMFYRASTEYRPFNMLPGGYSSPKVEPFGCYCRGKISIANFLYFPKVPTAILMDESTNPPS